MELPNFIINFLEKNNYTNKEVLQYNQRKETYVLKIKKDDSCYLLKAYDRDKTPKDIREKFIVEKVFYEKNIKIENLPKSIYFNDNILILEYFNSVSLRDYLIQNRNKQIRIKDLIKAIESFDHQLNRNNITTINYDNIFRYISSFCSSHPFQAKDIQVSFIDKQLNRIINKLLIVNVKRLIKTSDFKNLNGGFSHNDFHYNNILVTDDNKIKLIDFENIRYEGFFEFDILALIVMIEVYINNKEQIILDKFLEKLFDKNQLLKDIYKIYKIAISINKKFYIDSDKNYLSILSKIKLIFDLLMRIAK